MPVSCFLIRLALVVLMVAIAPRSAHAERRPMKPAARAELARGIERFAARDYAGAIAAYGAGFAIDPHPDFLYARGQAQRLSGDCAAAVESYRAFLASAPPASEAELTRNNLRRCEEELEREKKTRAGPDPAAAGSEPRSPSPEPRDSESAAAVPRPARLEMRGEVRARAVRPWYRDLFGGALVAGGAAGLAAGATFLVLADGRVDRANDADDLPQYETESDRAATRRTAGVICLVAGGALVAGGVARYLLLPESGVPVQIAPAAGGASVTLSGRF